MPIAPTPRQGVSTKPPFVTKPFERKTFTGRAAPKSCHVERSRSECDRRSRNIIPRMPVVTTPRQGISTKPPFVTKPFKRKTFTRRAAQNPVMLSGFGGIATYEVETSRKMPVVTMPQQGIFNEAAVCDTALQTKNLTKNNPKPVMLSGVSWLRAISTTSPFPADCRQASVSSPPWPTYLSKRRCD